MYYVQGAARRRQRRNRSLGDYCVVHPGGGRVCYGDQADAAQPAVPAYPLATAYTNCVSGGGYWNGYGCIIPAAAGTTAVVSASTPLPLGRSSRTPRDASNIYPNPLPLPATPATPSSASLPGTELLGTATEWLQRQSLVNGVPNWAVLAGAAALAYGVQKKRGRY